ELPSDLCSNAFALVELFDEPDVEAAYHRLFGGGGRVSPYESDYYGAGEEGMRERGVILGDVAGFYKAFGFDPSKETPEAPDHVVLELAFLSYMKLREAFALRRSEKEPYEICLAAEEKFLNEHLLLWLREFANRILRERSHVFYERAASLTITVLTQHSRHISPSQTA
ncbi:MAG: molecular chaperone TorD family protein, partial [Candidatus Lindowbacteria bacterium]|nr:molecular chaperone TorD family protein [Candidatus Lindowbacteria bacterium]